jgi:SET domain-containing protein
MRSSDNSAHHPGFGDGYHDPDPPCEAAESSIGVAVFATRDIARGDHILAIDGVLRREATRYSIQLDHGMHIEPECDRGEEFVRSARRWKYLNHSCDPNARIDGRTLVAIRPILRGEQVTFDYTTTEAEMAEPFACACGAAGCLGTVRGFVHLDPSQRAARSGRLAPHLASLAFVPGSES